ncbi:MAG TPA: GntR family transcriptional regulator [Candidatus Omnitrophica bacterium]|nr:GntR family transcriptional regulator [Candidatus Omnitrophota bacterium]
MSPNKRSLNIPEYSRIRENLRTLIKQGELKPGDAILPERMLCSKFGVSRMTVRQALLDLTNEGLLYRKQGKGTFVKEAKIESDISRLTSFTEDMLNRGTTPTSKLISQKLGFLSTRFVKRWNLPKDEKVIITKRLRFADGEPIAINTSHIPYYLCPALLEENLEKNSIKSILEEKYGLIFYYAEQTIEVGFAKKEEANLLKIKIGNPVFIVERVTNLENGKFLDFSLNIIRTDKYKFHITIRR